jgi:hypothetical protein
MQINNFAKQNIPFIATYPNDGGITADRLQ